MLVDPANAGLTARCLAPGLTRTTPRDRVGYDTGGQVRLSGGRDTRSRQDLGTVLEHDPPTADPFSATQGKRTQWRTPSACTPGTSRT
jgi:hypothetical protein